MRAIASEKIPREATVQVQEGARIILGEAFDAVPHTPPSQNHPIPKRSRQHHKFIDFLEANTGQASTSAAMTQLRVPRSQ